MSYIPASQVSPQAIEWLWPGRIALGKISLLEGDPELGKTWVTCDLCARLSVGQLFPDGQASPGPAASILLSGEDGSDDTLRPRLEALGADLTRVVLQSPREDEQPLRLPSESRRLECLIEKHNARLVVLDPWIAFLDADLQVASDAGIRRALRLLAGVARRRGCAILLIRHLRKMGIGRAIYRGLGSIGLVAACRSAWLIARSPLDDVCVFAQLKNNLAPRQSSLAYDFRTAGAEGKHDAASASGSSGDEKANAEQRLPFRWLGPTFWSADELTGGRLTRAGKRAQARVFLREFLHASAQQIGKVRAAAKELGIAKRTLARAASELKLQMRRVVLPGWQARNYWLLPGQKMPTVIPEECVVPEL
jgi:putative DNA primase/helicase